MENYNIKYSGSVFSHIVQFDSNLEINGGGFLVGANTTSPQEFGYLDGLSGNIQSQLNALTLPTEISC